MRVSPRAMQDRRSQDGRGHEAKPGPFLEFCQETTAHTFLQIGDPERYLWARIMWGIVLIVFTGCFGWQFGLLVERYYQYDVDVNTAVVTEKKMQFPMISVCNINPYQYGKVPDNSYLAQYLALVKTLLDNPDSCQMTMCDRTNNALTRILCILMASTNPQCKTPEMAGPRPGPAGVNATDQRPVKAFNLPFSGTGERVGVTLPGLGDVQPELGKIGSPEGVTIAWADSNANVDPRGINGAVDDLKSDSSKILGRKRRSLMGSGPDLNQPPDIGSQFAAILSTVVPPPQTNVSAAAATIADTLAPSLIDAVSASVQSNLSLEQVQAILSTVVPTLLDTSLPVPAINADPASARQPSSLAAGGASALKASLLGSVTGIPINQLGAAVNANIRNEVNTANAPGVLQSNMDPQSARKQPSSQNRISDSGQQPNGQPNGQRETVGQHATANQTKPQTRMSLLTLESLTSKVIGMIGQVEPELFGSATQPFDELIQECEFSSGDCGMSEDSAMPNPWYGACYSFNKNGTFESVRPGPLYGLAMQLFVNKKEYLPNVYTVGVRVSVDQPGRTPFPEIDGVFVPVGTSTAIGISVIENKRLGSPYSDCIQSDEGFEESNTLYYKSKYTPQGCQITCLQREIVKTCGCWHFAYQKPPDNDTHEFRNEMGVFCKNPTPTKTCFPLCDFKHTTACTAELEKSTEIDCTCPPICTDQKYQLTITESVWPARALPNCPPGATSCDRSSSDTKENQLKLMVYFESLTKFTYTESASYSLLSLISDFGGQFGLWIGASFCTVIEMISVLISLAVGCCGRDRSIEKRGRKTKEIYPSVSNGVKKQPAEYHPPPSVMY